MPAPDTKPRWAWDSSTCEKMPSVSEPPLRPDDPRFAVVDEPFSRAGEAARLVCDFGAMISCLLPSPPNPRVMDLGAGSGWLTEWLSRLGLETHAVDVSADVGNCLALRIRHDGRLQPERLRFQMADGHDLPFEDGFLGQSCCFDSLHHMRDYAKIIAELARVLAPGGRAIFVEPGARHSKSPETIRFIQEYKKDDPDWIERDVVLEEINALARGSGFGELVIRPQLLPNLREYRLSAWQRFRAGDAALQRDYIEMLKLINYDERLVFYLDKPSEPHVQAG